MKEGSGCVSVTFFIEHMCLIGVWSGEDHEDTCLKRDRDWIFKSYETNSTPITLATATDMTYV